MRLFFALEVPADLALGIADWRARALPLAGREVPAANFHITLAFIGELAEAALDTLCREVDAQIAARPAAAGQLQLDQVGYWPRPGIFWLGPQTWPDTLGGLAHKLGGLGARHGSERRRDRFQPHVTLFRHCTTPPPAPTELPQFALPYREFLLMESRQGRHGVRYAPVAGWSLGDPL
ncbi:RNA 2',3'-cyclic phosphodiesterase [Mangrovimicrobium sediminis]|uniref:RNA 2',3'-cyclic phosphodiesterase n=1 Tax=Mangrovimicrobium sediminis TaxID=2562682 RepID=A0A4Z0LY06_9GAMM|nr:RNA 2',3'-cyclic phosphodiesterase [Haliea sp. SAOS-164]TGD72056.1 RNA 2',3'-cyclic phosphodiesterase [Haliea sp. SAOS-164]